MTKGGIPQTPAQVLAKFWSQVDVNGPGGCWLWTGYKNERGYGLLSTTKNDNMRAHRYSWELLHGPTPSDQFCLHKCDVRACVNPDHIYLGSYKENTRDMVERGRDRFITRASLSPGEVREIRRDYKQTGPRKSNVRELLARFPHSSKVAIYMAATGRTWKDVK